MFSFLRKKTNKKRLYRLRVPTQISESPKTLFVRVSGVCSKIHVKGHFRHEFVARNNLDADDNKEMRVESKKKSCVS